MSSTTRSSSTTTAGSTGVISKRSEMPLDLLEKFEALQAKKNAPNPLYALEAHTYGNFQASYAAPVHARAGNFSRYFMSKKGLMKSTLDTSITKSKFPTR